MAEACEYPLTFRNLFDKRLEIKSLINIMLIISKFVSV